MLKSEYRSVDSKRDPYPNAKIELEAFHTAIYGLHVDYTWRNEPGRDRVILRVMMPSFDKNSEYAYSLKAIAKEGEDLDRKSIRLNSSHVRISYAVFCLKKKKKT